LQLNWNHHHYPEGSMVITTIDGLLSRQMKMLPNDDGSIK